MTNVLERVKNGELSVVVLSHENGMLKSTNNPDETAELLRLAELGQAAERDNTPRAAEEWHEDMGPVLWWVLPVQEPPYDGSPLDCDWVEGIYTHFTMIPEPLGRRGVVEYVD